MDDPNQCFPDDLTFGSNQSALHDDGASVEEEDRAELEDAAGSRNVNREKISETQNGPL